MEKKMETIIHIYIYAYMYMIQGITTRFVGVMTILAKGLQ